MTNLSYKQELFKTYLIKKIGFIEDAFLNKYVSLLEMVSPKLKHLGKQKKIWSEEEQKFLPEKEDPYNKYIEKDNYFLPEKFNVIDLLNIELNIKKNSDYTLKPIQLNFISATDISNFTYCPVSFAISKTFELPKLESAILGTSQHEKQTLINYLRPFKETEYIDLVNTIEVEKTLSFNPLLNDDNRIFFDELSKSSIVFYGHDGKESKNKYFKSVNGNFVGQPDYIFKNDTTNDIFVVEEKFQFLPKDPSTFDYSYYSNEEEQKIIKKRTSKTFFSNHINQLSSYIYGIGEYDIKYGYLVYWKYELDNGNPNIVACNVLRIDKTENGRQQIRETFINLKNLITNKGGVFDVNTRVPAKCASCVSNLLCGHKTGKFNSFSIPYSKDYIKVYFATFPEELKKKIIPAETNIISTQTPNDNPP
jgi:hypothetical protein